MNRIDATFDVLRKEQRMGLFPYLTAGFPTLDATERLVRIAVESGADGLELGIPFSDPLADGATMQHASEVALNNGASLSWGLALTERLRSQVEVPLMLMTYYNPVHRYGVQRFVVDAVAAGADGVIVPDLPSTEAAQLMAAASEAGFYVIQMVAPTTVEERLDEVGRTAQGCVYCVSLLGTTGARVKVADRLPEFMSAVRRHVRTPLLIGFGIARPEHIRAVAPYAEAVIVGSAIVDLLSLSTPDQQEAALGSYIRELRGAC